MADTFNTDYTIQLFPKAPEQVPIRETIERVAGRMLGIVNAEIDALQATVGDESSGLVKDLNEVEAKVGDYDPVSTGRTMTQDLSAAYTPIMKQGVRAKMDKIATGTDDLYETLENKSLVHPLINDETGAHASYTITLTPAGEATGSITLTMRQMGLAGNAWIVKSSIGFEYDRTSKEIVIDNSAVISTGQAFLDWYNGGTEAGADDLQEDIVVTYTGDMTLMLPDLSEPSIGEFAGGVDPHVVVSTGAELDATVDKSPTAGAPTLPVTAKLTTGADDSEIDWEADVAGAAGNDIRLTFEVPATSLSVATNTAASEIILTAVKGVHPVSITLLGGLSQSLSVSAVGSDITVQLATDGSSVVTSTAADVLAAILAAMATGQPLNGILSSAVEGASYVGTTLMLAQAIDYFDATADIVVDVSDPLNIVASVKYDGATDAPISTATEMKNAVNLASGLITGTVTGTGNDPVAEITEEAFTGGENGTPAAAGAIRYETGKLWISTDISTVSVSNWEYVTLT